jgi:hypothetical protein
MPARSQMSKHFSHHYEQVLPLFSDMSAELMHPSAVPVVPTLTSLHLVCHFFLKQSLFLSQLITISEGIRVSKCAPYVVLYVKYSALVVF